MTKWMKYGLSVIILLLSMSSLQAATLIFEDNFDTLNSTVWNANSNNASLTVNGGWINLLSSSLDAPYVRTWPGSSIFPSSDGFALEVGFRYTSIQSKGVGLRLLDASKNTIGAFWSDSYYGFRVVGGGVSSIKSANTAPHAARWEFLGGSLNVYLDDVLIGTDSYTALPEVLWFGHPSINQLAYTGAPSTNNGIVVSRWWGAGDWTDLSLDYVRVSAVSIPVPPTMWLVGSGFAGLLFSIVRRR